MEATARLIPHKISQNEPHTTNYYAPVSQGRQLGGTTAGYHLKRYLWRSFLTITGPLMVLTFYAFICVHYLAYPLSNNVLKSSPISATWVYYCWFLLSVFILEWARTGLANIEASALMIPRLTPTTARELMWHADANWANPLWWLRAIRSTLWKLLGSKKPVPMPSALWMLLSLVHMLAFVAIPLAGLSIEVADASVYASRRALIYGPNANSFNTRMYVDFPQRIRRNWESGRQTSPLNGAMLYAPDGSRNVSATYFDDQAIEAVRNANSTVIRIFAGPAVREPIWGDAWGMSANISCFPTPLNQLQMIRSDGYNSSVNVCSTNKGCEFQWLSAEKASQINGVSKAALNIPLWLNESRHIDPTIGLQAYSLLAATDGWSTMFVNFSTNDTISPYNRLSNHDAWTFDHIVKGTPVERVTNSMFEVLLWQAGSIDTATVDDDIFKNYKNHPSPLIAVYNGTMSLINDLNITASGIFIGFGVHCDIMSAVGTASFDPDKRTFSNFARAQAAPAYGPFDWPVNIGPVQTHAIASMSGNQYMATINDALAPREASDRISTLAAVHSALGSSMLPRAGDMLKNTYYPTLTVENLTLAMYKLLGESVISLMGEGGVNPWTSPDLYTLSPAKYLRSGAVPWKLALTLLALWAISTSLGALSTLLFAGPRWAPTLSGFELFKFGAQYQDDVHKFETVDFQGCTGSLAAIPGMVGMLPGSGRAPGSDSLGFIGLSENVADKRRRARYTLDRERAAKARPG